MATNGQNVAYETLRSLAYTSIGSSFTAVGTGFFNPCRILKIKNLTNANIIVSFDGVNNHDVIPATSGEIDDYGSDKASQIGVFNQKAGTIVYVKQESGAPTSGTLYVTVIYASVV